MYLCQAGQRARSCGAFLLDFLSFRLETGSRRQEKPVGIQETQDVDRGSPVHSFDPKEGETNSLAAAGDRDAKTKEGEGVESTVATASKGEERGWEEVMICRRPGNQ